jgi:hypothetical protein
MSDPLEDIIAATRRRVPAGSNPEQSFIAALDGIG